MPEQWIDDVVGDEARPRPGFEDRLAGELRREWRGGRSRWRVVAWTAASVALVVGAVAVLTRDDHGSVVPADTTVPTTAPSALSPSSSVPTVAGAPFVAIGDSVMLEVKDLLEADGIIVDAKENRGVAGTKAALDAAVKSGTIGISTRLLVQVGLHERMSSADLDSILASVPAHVEWVSLMTVTGPVRWLSANNNLIRSVSDRDPRVRVLDWEYSASSLGMKFCPDGIHVSCVESTRVAYANVIREDLAVPREPTPTTSTMGPATTTPPGSTTGVARYLTALATGDYGTAAELLNDGGLELEARADVRPLFRPEFGLVPGQTSRAAVAAALEKWCARALCVQPMEIVDLPDGRWTKAVFPVGDVTRSAVFSDFQYEGQTVVNGLPPLMPPAFWTVEFDASKIVDCPVDQVTRVDWADVNGDGWVEQLVSQMVIDPVDEAGISTYRITVCGTTTQVAPFETTGDGLVVYPVNPAGEGADTLLIGFAEGYPNGTIWRLEGSRIVEIPGTSWGFGPPLLGAEQRSVGCADVRGDGTIELVNYTFTESSGRLQYTTTLAVGGGVGSHGDLDANSPEAGDIRIGLCNGLPAMTN